MYGELIVVGREEIIRLKLSVKLDATSNLIPITRISRQHPKAC